MSAAIMIVDDEEAIANLVEVYLKNEGFTVYKCFDAAQALQCVEREKLDLAILDVMLPDLEASPCARKSGSTICFPF